LMRKVGFLKDFRDFFGIAKSFGLYYLRVFFYMGIEGITFC